MNLMQIEVNYDSITYLSTSLIPSGQDLPHWLSNGMSYDTRTEPNLPNILFPVEHSTAGK